MTKWAILGMVVVISAIYAQDVPNLFDNETISLVPGGEGPLVFPEAMTQAANMIIDIDVRIDPPYFSDEINLSIDDINYSLINISVNTSMLNSTFFKA